MGLMGFGVSPETSNLPVVKEMRWAIYRQPLPVATQSFANAPLAITVSSTIPAPAFDTSQAAHPSRPAGSATFWQRSSGAWPSTLHRDRQAVLAALRTQPRPPR